MTRLSIETAFSWAQRFIAREWGLLLPIALAFMALPPLALGLVVPDDVAKALAAPVKDLSQATAVFGHMLPIMLVLLAISSVGGLAITALALTPGMSVGEAIVHAVRRFPVLAGSVLLLAVALVLVALVGTTLLTLIGMPPVKVQSMLMAFLLVALAFLLVRMTPLLGVIVDRRIGSIDAIREAWMMGRGAGWKMALAIFVYNLGSLIIVVALVTAVGACLLAAARLGGWPDIAPPLVAVFERVLASVFAGGFYVLAANFYRQLSRNKGI